MESLGKAAGVKCLLQLPLLLELPCCMHLFCTMMGACLSHLSAPISAAAQLRLPIPYAYRVWSPHHTHILQMVQLLCPI